MQGLDFVTYWAPSLLAFVVGVPLEQATISATISADISARSDAPRAVAAVARDPSGGMGGGDVLLPARRRVHHRAAGRRVHALRLLARRRHVSRAA